MAYNMAWFRKQAELKKAEEEKAKAEAAAKEAVATEEAPEDPGVNITNDNHSKDFFKFHINHNAEQCKHWFLAEELGVPRANYADTQRLQMFSNHINQHVHLKNPEYPKVFTNFEDQIGEYSVAYKKAKEDFEIINKIVKNQYNYDLIVKYKKSGVYDIIHYRYGRNITEDYGLRLNDCIPDKGPGDVVHEGEFVYKSDNYDDDGNYRIGVNLKALYMPFKNLTYEDGVVISESAAAKLTSFKCEKTMFSVNGNDVLLNLYGDEKHYKGFPEVGDPVDGTILVASRRKDKRSSLYEFQANKMRQIDNVNDEIIYSGGGTVVDLTIYNNIPLSELQKKTDEFSVQACRVLENQYRYWNEMKEALEKIIPVKALSEKEQAQERQDFGMVCDHPMPRAKNPNKYTDELDYYWKLAHENTNERILWRYDGKSFDNFKMEFTILKEDHLAPGCKITGRYGNKGVITMICKDEEMPVNEYGERAEICLNPLGVVNRLNPAQLQEVYLNFMADHVVRLMKQTDDYNKKADLFLSFLKEINKKEYDFYDLEMLMMNRAQKEELINEVEEKGIFIHQPPFFGNTTEEQFKKIYKEHPEWCSEYKFEGIEKPMTMGDIYMFRLKHQSSNKMSLRSANSLNVKNLPAKSTMRKQKKVLYSSTPIRLGEMEINGLMLSKRPDLVEKLLKAYSTNEEAREDTIMQLLCPPDGKDPLAMDLDLDLSKKSISREILDKYLGVLGYKLTDTNIKDSKKDGDKK